MACRSVGNYLYNQCIGIAVRIYFPDMLKMTGLFPLVPQLLPAAAEKPGFSRCKSPLQRLFIHISDHQDLPVAGILYDGRNQSSVIIFQILNFYCFHDSPTCGPQYPDLINISLNRK